MASLVLLAQASLEHASVAQASLARASQTRASQAQARLVRARATEASGASQDLHPLLTMLLALVPLALRAQALMLAKARAQ